MTGVITDRMSPACEHSNFQGPPSASKLTNEPRGEGEIDRNPRKNEVRETSDCVVLFITDAALGQSPQIEIKVAGKWAINAMLDSGSEVNLVRGSI